MHIEMASQAVRKHFQLSFVVRFAMTFETVWEFAVRLMANDTTNLSVLAMRTLPLAVNFIMTATTGLRVDITREINS